MIWIWDRDEVLLRRRLVRGSTSFCEQGSPDGDPRPGEKRGEGRGKR